MLHSPPPKKKCFLCLQEQKLHSNIQHDVFICIFLLFFLFVELSNLIAAYILIGGGERLTANKLSLNLTCSKRLYRLKVFLDPRRAHLSSVVLLEVMRRKITYSVFFVVLAPTSNPPPPSVTLDSLRPSHPDLCDLFFFAAELTSLFNSIDSRLHFGKREEVHLNVYPCCDVCSALCWAPRKTHKLAPSTMAPWSNLLVRDINMEREASCERVLSEAKWLGGDVTIQQMLDNGPPSPTLTHIHWRILPDYGCMIIGICTQMGAQTCT